MRRSGLAVVAVDDHLRGGGARDVISGGSGTDDLRGGHADDLISSVDGITGNDANDGGTGLDRCRIDEGDTATRCP